MSQDQQGGQWGWGGGREGRSRVGGRRGVQTARARAVGMGFSGAPEGPELRLVLTGSRLRRGRGASGTGRRWACGWRAQTGAWGGSGCSCKERGRVCRHARKRAVKGTEGREGVTDGGAGAAGEAGWEVRACVKTPVTQPAETPRRLRAQTGAELRAQGGWERGLGTHQYVHRAESHQDREGSQGLSADRREATQERGWAPDAGHEKPAPGAQATQRRGSQREKASADAMGPGRSNPACGGLRSPAALAVLFGCRHFCLPELSAHRRLVIQFHLKVICDT